MYVHRAERTDLLVEGLADVLMAPPADPFDLDVVAVPSRGVERWLSQRLSHRLGRGSVASSMPSDDAAPELPDGVCAGVLFPSPADLVAECLDAAGGAGAESPWAPERLQWAIVPILDEIAAGSSQQFSLLRGYLRRAWADGVGAAALSTRRLATARMLAGLFDSYSAQRPQLIRAWVDGRDEDGSGEKLPEDLAWQAELWRQVRTRIATPAPAEELPEVLEMLRTDPQTVSLPQRISVFGPTRLTSMELQILVALAEHREVHLWLPHPSPRLWEAVADALSTEPSRSPLRNDGDLGGVVRVSLLGSLGRDARELQQRLTANLTGDVSDDVRRPTERPHTLLARLQQALADDELPPVRPIDPGDFSVQVHACHGLPRQVEVLRELLVGLLADDPTLEPRDIVVMCPDVERVAPLAIAAFEQSGSAESGERHPGQRIRVRVADRALTQLNPLLRLVSDLLDLADARLTLEQVLGLAESAPVRRCFRFTDDDLETLLAWLPAAGIRWGTDPDQRGRHGMPEAVTENSWRTGLDRILLGAAVSEDGLPTIGGVLPLDDVASNDLDLAGRLAEFVERLDLVLQGLRQPQPVTGWAAALLRGIDLLAAPDPAQLWQDSAARDLLDEVIAEARVAAADPAVCLQDIRVLMADRLAGRPSRRDFRTGDVTLCSLTPMRSVPHRVVCLLGLDDDAFPRVTTGSADDILARRPFVGDRDGRSEDRQILLDAIHAATERLLVLHTGMNPRTNAVEPISVPIQEVIDLLLQMSAGAGDDQAWRTASERILVRHRLQPFDPRNFATTGDRPVCSPVERAFSFDRPMFEAAGAARGPRAPAAAVGGLLLPSAPLVDVAMEDLVRLLEHPANGFLRQRLGSRPPDDADAVPTELPLEMSALENWQIGDRLLRALRRVDERTLAATRLAAATAEHARGTVPPGGLGAAVVGQAMDAASSIDVRTRQELRNWGMPERGRSVPLWVTCGSRILSGTLAEVAINHTRRVIVTATFSKVGAKQRLRAWLALLFAAAAEPEHDWRALLVGRGREGAAVEVYYAPTEASELLTDLVELRDVGLRTVLPTPAATACAYITHLHRDTVVARTQADYAWAGDFGDGRDWCNTWAWGPGASIDVLLEQPTPAGVPVHAGRWFDHVAERIWGPLLRNSPPEGS